MVKVKSSWRKIWRCIDCSKEVWYGSTRCKSCVAKERTQVGLWKGEDVGYTGLHHWLRRNKVKVDLCENCNLKPPHDLANISGKYKRDINDFKWLCRRCHMIEDGRLEKLRALGKLNTRLKVVA